MRFIWKDINETSSYFIFISLTFCCTSFKIELLLSFKREHGFVDVWLVKDNIKINNLVLQKSEVSEAKWVSIEELKRLIDDEQFVKSVDLYYDLFVKLLKKCHNVK